MSAPKIPLRMNEEIRMFRVGIGRAPITVDAQGRRGVISTARSVFYANAFRIASLLLALVPAAALGQTLPTPSGTPNFASLSLGTAQGTPVPAAGTFSMGASTATAL